MQFRPCIDIHAGKVKQIVGSSITDASSKVKENFVSDRDAADFANLYKKKHITGGHIILLDKKGTPDYEATKKQAISALHAYPNGMQVGGGITPQSAIEFLEAGASHVIVTSYVFSEGRINYDRLKELSNQVGKEHLVLDVSARRKDDDYYVVTDRWQKFTQEKISEAFLDELSSYADEFLIHAVDVEGKNSGIESELAQMLGQWGKIPLTYAGGISSMEDIDTIYRLGGGNINVTIGSAMDTFGGSLKLEEVLNRIQSYQ
ncbi:phosphoribosylformimino-5-aminoimidazole carboxamide ribotide isomerase [Eubacterium oxidoreducens]|uniref:1-(5-phosphoribosyl)-5-[(5-phosphoribosylamino)methylideneamino] imidazole-4-carboxamide isomerase n=1 Tax=Eubacterium oxidoreducens TaxID=1732 RepID=A0A1G6AC97_EUBOX|nr:phosphoribosylformimino-5-aminoimidazole carboxamide ribotide isomerase [Eubacterium oxidoreducens]SDB05946.1 1-(5-phosphoribosyl)-5-[(5-phosphoribosylamino)methylideneamino] imidazole-4-carboxamide isomerase [Eubacterium oxidoreducens]